MRKFTLAISISAAALAVSACNPPAEAPKEETTEVDAGDTPTPEAEVDANATAAGDTAQGGTTETKSAVAENESVDENRGGDPSIKPQ